MHSGEPSKFAASLLEHEARALLTRLDRVAPFALHETMVMAAAPSPAARQAIERHLAHGRRDMRHKVCAWIAWIRGPGRKAPPALAQRQFTFLRLQFNAMLTQFDIYADVISQRSEHDTGVWLAGLDVLAADALALPGTYFQPPPVVCYLDRGVGAAIRRARTRLPGGALNPVAVLRIPRERMVGVGVASSVAHEVGHQAVALLDLLPGLRNQLGALPGEVAPYWQRWISEIVPDVWSVARLGVTATLGLMAVVTLPRAFVFRGGLEDPHPIPWFRVMLGCALGQALYPHPQWARLSRLWESFYPRLGLPPAMGALLARLQASTPDFIEIVLNHPQPALRGASIRQALASEACHPARLMQHFDAWQSSPGRLKHAAPCQVFAAFGQARMEGRLSAEKEGSVLASLLTHWALERSLDASPPGWQRAA